MDGICIHRCMGTKWGAYHIALKEEKGLGTQNWTKTCVTANLEEFAHRLILGWALSFSLCALSLSLFLTCPVCSYEAITAITAITLLDQEHSRTMFHLWQQSLAGIFRIKAADNCGET